MMRWLALLLVPAALALAATCDEEEVAEPTPTATTAVGPTDTPPATATDTPIPSTDTPAPATEPPPAEPTAVPMNRRDCDAIRGTDYRSPEERTWFLGNCIAPTPAQQQQPPPQQPPAQACHPSYEDACLDPNCSDYDCAGGSGNGPCYTGRVRVVGPDVFDLDRDGDGIGCE